MTDLEKSLNKKLEITGDTDTVTVTHPDFLIRWDNFAVSEIFSSNNNILICFIFKLHVLSLMNFIKLYLMLELVERKYF